jgi:thiol-disulfide isomerase/thioredoxin
MSDHLSDSDIGESRPISKMQATELDKMASRFQVGAPVEKSRLPLIIAGAVGLFMVGALIWFNSTQNSPISEGSPATEALPGVPEGAIEATLISSTGRERTIQSLQDKVVIITFWSPDCEPCLANLRDLKGVFSQYADRGLEIIPVLIPKQNVPEKATTTEANPAENSADKIEVTESTEDSAVVATSSIEELWEQLGMPYPYYKDQNQKLTQLLKVDTVPTTAVLNKNGEVVMIGAGLSGWSETESTDSIEKLLAE